MQAKTKVQDFTAVALPLALVREYLQHITIMGGGGGFKAPKKRSR